MRSIADVSPDLVGVPITLRPLQYTANSPDNQYPQIFYCQPVSLQIFK